MFDTISTFMMRLVDFAAQHIVWALPIGAIALIILAPSAAMAVFNFLTRTVPGQIISALVVAAVCAWMARGYVDAAAKRTSDIVEAGRLAAVAKAEAAASAARFAELQRQVAAANAITDAANARADASDAAVTAYQKREADYETQLSKRPTPVACGLSAGDVGSLRAAARVFGPGRKARPSALARQLWPAGAYP